MRAVIDTHVFLWMIMDSERLSPDARKFIADIENDLFLSAASLWEIAIKTSLGKLQLMQPFEQFIPQQIHVNAINILPIALEHLSTMINLPFHHRDPFDRLIIAQCIAEGMPVICSDASFARYSVVTIW